MPNWEIIEQHIQNMEEALTELGKYGNISFEEFQRDLSLRWVFVSIKNLHRRSDRQVPRKPRLVDGGKGHNMKETSFARILLATACPGSPALRRGASLEKSLVKGGT